MGNKKLNYSIEINAEISDILKQMDKVSSSLSGLSKNSHLSGLEKNFEAIQKALNKLQNTASQPINSISDFEKAKREARDVTEKISNLGSTIANLQRLSNSEKISLLSPAEIKNIEEAVRLADQLGTAFKNARKSSEEYNKAVEDYNTKNRAAVDLEKEQSSLDGKIKRQQALVTKQQEAVNIAEKQKEADRQALEDAKARLEVLKKFKNTEAAYDKAGADKTQPLGEGTKQKNYATDRQAAQAKFGDQLDKAQVADLEKEVEELQKTYNNSSKALTDANSSLREYGKTLEDSQRKLEIVTEELPSLQEAARKAEEEVKRIGGAIDQVSFDELRKSAIALDPTLTDLPIEYTEENVKALEKALRNLEKKGLDKVNAALKTAERQYVDCGQNVDTFKDKIENAGAEVEQLDTKISNTSAIMDRVKAFVGLQGGIEIARHALRNAIDTITELDAVMTEMAVVTDLEVADYWEQLPEHTARANELGMAIKSVYEAETLYYQQGLKSSEVTAMSAETLKLARIAGLSAEDATNKMTAALRGFNMELNETSAQRISDVYSELAAITASDVNEISSAMTKTASIAASAGMEFETTAAFLSQIIETTRESAETAGTAMKTVIARFQELKKDPAEIGEVDGEIVDANKIETALRSVGVSLRDASGQFRDLDEVFLELSSKWDSLDTNTQRYIATIAAGSRQQSRFIAMMSDYNRTQELVTATNTSAGASNRQFEKTVDSLESKVTKLKNAWNTFTMDIANSNLIKGAIDLLTKILTTINKVTDAFGEFSGAAKIALLVGALYLGDKALKIFRQTMTETGSIFSSVGATMTGTFSAVKADIDAAILKVKQFKASMSFAQDIHSANFTAPQVAALDEYTNALNRLTLAQQRMDAMEKAGMTNDPQYALYASMKAQATLDLNKSLSLISSRLGLTTSETSLMVAMVKSGIAVDKAAIAVKNEKVLAILREKGAIDELNNVLDENILKNTMSNMTDNADNVNKFGDSISNLGKKMQGFDVSKLKNGLQGLGKGFSNLGKGIWNVIKAVGKFIGSCWSLLLVIGILVVAIVGLIHYIKYLQKTSPEGKLKAAQEAADRAAEAADRAKESYQELSDSLNSLDDKYAGLEELTKGTREWKEAVAEINSEVLDLIDKYPELANFYESVDGVLQVKEGAEDDIEQVLNNAALKTAQAQAMELTAKQNVNKAELDVAYKNLSKDAKFGNQDAQNAHLWSAVTAAAAAGAAGGAAGGAAIGTAGGPIGTGAGAVIGGIAGGIGGAILGGVGAHAGMSAIQKNEKINDKKSTEIIAEAIADGKFNPTDVDAFTEYLQEEFDVTAEVARGWAEELQSASGELAEFGEAINAAKQEEEAYNAAMAQAAVQAVDLTKYTTEEQSQIMNAASAEAYAVQQEAALKRVEEADKDQVKEMKAEVAKSMYGEDATVSGNKITYTDESGEEQTVELSNEEFKANYAATEATEKMTEALETVPGIIDKVSSELNKKYEGVGDAFRQSMTDPSKMTIGQAEAMAAVTNEELKQVYSQLTDKQKEYYGSEDEFITQWNDSVDDQNKKSQEASDKIAKLSKDMGTLNKSLTADNAKAYAEELSSLSSMIEGNAEDLAAINEDMNAIGAMLSPEQFNSFMSLWNSFDKSDLTAWEDFEESLDELGLSAILDTAAFQGLSEKTKKWAHAIEKVDLDSLSEKLQNYYKMASEIQSERSRKIDKETYEALINIDDTLAREFNQLGDNFYYLGSSVDNLVKVLKQETIRRLDLAKTQLQDQRGIYDVITNIDETREAYGRVTHTEREPLTFDEWFDENAGLLARSYRESQNRNFQNFQNPRVVGQTQVPVPVEKIQTVGGGTIYKYDYADINSPTEARTAEQKAFDMTLSLYKSKLDDPNSDLYRDVEKVDQAGTVLDLSSNNFQNWDISAKQAYLERFLSSMGSLMIEGAVSEDALSQLGLGWLSVGTQVDSLDENKVDEALQAIYTFSNINIEQLKEQWEETSRQLRIANYTLQSAEYNKSQIDLSATSEEKIKESIERSIALQTQALEKGILSETVAGFYSELMKKLEDGTITEPEKEQLGKLQTDMTKHLKIIEDNQAGISEITKYENKVAEALYNNSKKEIDKLSDINDSVNEANDKLLSKIQESINKERQKRENQKAEKEITNTQAQAAYLMADSSGSGLLEAMMLEESALEQQQDYEDSLIDQELQKIADANAQAAEQRERQIAILEAILEQDKESGVFSRQAEAIVATSLQQINSGVSPLETELAQIVFTEDNWGALTTAGLTEAQAAFIQGTVAAATAYSLINSSIETNTTENTNGLENLPTELDTATLNSTISAIKTMLEKEYGTYTPPKTGSTGSTGSTGTTTGSFNETTGNQYKRDEAVKKAKTAAAKTDANGNKLVGDSLMSDTDFSSAWDAYVAAKGTEYKTKEDFYKAATAGIDYGFKAVKGDTYTIKDMQSDLADGKAEHFSLKVNDTNYSWLEVSGDKYSKGEQLDKIYKHLSGKDAYNNAILVEGSGFWVRVNNMWRKAGYTTGIGHGKDKSSAKFQSLVGDLKNRVYKTGGLADFTGPAWLDGTKSHPELVLNARDTENFIQLKDILSEALNGTNTIHKSNEVSNGDNYFDIQITVEDIKDDYDVEQLANKIRSMLYDDAMHRNVNAVSFIR